MPPSFVANGRLLQLVKLRRRLLTGRDASGLSSFPPMITGICVLCVGPGPLPACFLLQKLRYVHSLPTRILGLSMGFRLGSSSADARPSLAMMMMRVKKPITPRSRSMKTLCFSVKVRLLGPKRFLVGRKKNKKRKLYRESGLIRNICNKINNCLWIQSFVPLCG